MATVKFMRPTPVTAPSPARRGARELGIEGEQAASRYLEQQGYTVVEHNYRHGRCEVDLVAIDGGVLAIIEVKTRSGNGATSPESAVDHRKRQHLLRAANHYVQSHGWQGETRFDILTVVADGGRHEIRLIKGAYNAMNL